MQDLTNFITEFTILDKEGDTDEVERWTIQTNSSRVQRRGGVGVIIITPKGEALKYRVQLAFLTTNNETEFEGVLRGLRVEKALGVKNLLLQSDSKLVIGQIKGEFGAKEERMQKYLKLTKLLTQKFDWIEFTQIPRSQNMGADELAK